MVTVELAVEKDDCKQRCKEHLSTTHHLVDAGGDAQQADVHQHGGDEIKDGRGCEQQHLAPLALVMLWMKPVKLITDDNVLYHLLVRQQRLAEVVLLSTPSGRFPRLGHWQAK